jgi:hypothetical protein
VAALVVIGVILCGGSLFVLIRRALLLREAVQVSGVVISIQPAYDAHLAGLFHHVQVPHDVPIVRFRTADDAEVVARLPPASSGEYVSGQSVSFFYNPRYPQHIVRSRAAQWVDVLPFFLIGVLCFISLIWLQ